MFKLNICSLHLLIFSLLLLFSLTSEVLKKTADRNTALTVF